MSKKTPPSLTAITDSVGKLGHGLGRYKVILFIVLVAVVYGFVLLHINQDNSAQPSQDQISAQSSPVAKAHIDKSVVAQLQKLQDNSVSVKTLFQQARNNPFQD